MDATQYMAMVRRWWWLLIVGTLMAVGTYGVAVRVRESGQAPAEPVYSASAMFFVDAPALTSNIDRLTQSYGTIIAGRGVAERMVANLGLQISPADVQSRIDVQTPAGSQLIQVTTKGATAEDAQHLLDGVAQAFIALRQEGNLPGTVSMAEVNRAQQVAAPAAAGSSVLRSAILVAMLGMIGAAAIVVAFEYMTDAVRDRADVEHAGSVPALGSIPAWNIGRGFERVLAMRSGGTSPVAERYRMLRTAIGLATREAPAQAILIAGAAPGAGASTTAANVAAALAQQGRRVAIVDADMRAGSLHRVFGVAAGAGLSDALSDDSMHLEQIIRSTPAAGVMLVPSGAVAPNAAELLDSPRFDAVMRALRERFDAIVVDCPPVPQVTDATVLAAKCDATIIVVRGDHTRRSDLAATVAALRPATTRILGTVLNGDTSVPGGGFFGFRVAATRTERAAARA
jgi:capsular exopolysaccharide synthesis family protein